MQVRIAVQRAAAGEAIDQREAHRRAIHHRDGDGQIELHDGRRVDRGEQAIQGHDPWPVRGIPRRRLVVNGCDGRLQSVRTDRSVGRAGRDEPEALVDAGSIPATAILVLEQHQLPIQPDPRSTPRVAEQHERQQAARLGFVRQQFGHEAGQPDRLAAQLPANDAVAGRGRVALVVHEVQHLEHAVDALWQHRSRGHVIRDPGVADLPLGTHQPLRQGGFGHEERPRDLGRRQATERAQRQRDPRFERERRVAAREDQAKAVVVDGHVVVGRDLHGVERGQLRLDRCLARQRLGLVPEPTSAAQAVDRAVARGRRDPRPGIGRDAALRPRLERRDERVLDGFLGKIEVAQDTDEGRDRPSLLLAEQALDDLPGGGVRRRQSTVAASMVRSAGCAEKSHTGRTSIDAPYPRPGQRPARSSASSRSLASIR